MIYIIFILPALTTSILAAYYAHKVWNYYETKHGCFYKQLNVIDNRPKTKAQWFIAQWVRVSPSTYVDPESKETHDVLELSKDLELAKSIQDPVLIKLVITRIRLWQASIALAGFIPLFITIYWAIKLL